MSSVWCFSLHSLKLALTHLSGTRCLPATVVCFRILSSSNALSMLQLAIGMDAASYLPSPHSSRILGIQGTIRGKLLPYFSFNCHPSRIPHICKSHHSLFFAFFFCPFVGLMLENQIVVCKRTRQSRFVFHHSPGHKF